MLVLPASNCKVVKVQRPNATVAAADDFSPAIVEAAADEILFEGRADGNLYQADSITSNGEEVTVVAVRKLVLPAVAELKLNDLAIVQQSGVTGLRAYRITSLGLDSSALLGGGVYLCTVQETELPA